MGTPSRPQLCGANHHETPGPRDQRERVKSLASGGSFMMNARQSARSPAMPNPKNGKALPILRHIRGGPGVPVAAAWPYQGLRLPATMVDEAYCAARRLQKAFSTIKPRYRTVCFRETRCRPAEIGQWPLRSQASFADPADGPAAPMAQKLLPISLARVNCQSHKA